MIIFGASEIGKQTLLACRAKGLDVECFIDYF